jgi:hypothetical protein
LNRGIEVLQTSALPLGYAAVLPNPLLQAGFPGELCALCLERETGLEPATPTLARWCSTTELFPQKGFFLDLFLFTNKAFHFI